MINNNDDNIKQVSNIKLSKDCYKYFKKLSIDKETSLQHVISELLEKHASNLKDNKQK